LLSALVLLGGAPAVRAADDDTQAQLKAMQDRMQAMEDQLQAANKRVDEQNDVIQRAGLAETRGSSSGLPGFLGSIDIGGWVAASYLYNVNDPNDHNNPDGGLKNTNVGFSGQNGPANNESMLAPTFYPLHPDHNSFSLDQLWFEIERKISEENRAGFRADILYGTTAGLLPGSIFNGNRSGNDSTTSFYIQQAYIQYLAPILGGITIKAGKFGDLLGVERAGTIYNWNITRGTIWTLFEPINHVGVSIGGPIGDTGFDWTLAGINGFSPDSPDINDGKSVTGHLGWHNDQFTVAINGIWGPERLGNDGHQNGVANGLIKWTPSERFGMYLNGDYAWLQKDTAAAWGISLAARFGITDRTGIALRGEYAQDVDKFFGFTGCGGDFGNTVNPTTGAVTGLCGATGIQTYGITMTLDHLLTDQLMIRGEARYDWISKDTGKDSEFFQNGRYDITSSKNLPNDQIVVGVELIYNFNKFGMK
jgi:hypothetical protein